LEKILIKTIFVNALVKLNAYNHKIFELENSLESEVSPFIPNITSFSSSAFLES
jgi:hypothetical protein